MVQRHKDELIEALPEVDLFLGSAEVDRNASLARGFYVAAAVLVAAGGGLLWWDLQADAMGVQAHF